MEELEKLKLARLTGRPRMGAWIEIELSLRWQVTRAGRPRMGAWIEIATGMWRSLTC